MDRSDIMTLVAKTYTVDAIGQKVPAEQARDVFAQIDSVTQSEWYEAGRAGLKAEYRATIFFGDYAGEEIARIGGVTYGIYRTYRRKDDTIELYLERKAGL